MNVEYIVNIKGNTSALEKALKDAQGSMKRLSDDEVLIKLGYDGNIKGFNKTFDSVLKACPELTVQFQYDVNKKILAQELDKLDVLKDFTVDVDTESITKKVMDMATGIKNSFENGSLAGDELIGKLQYLFKYINTANDFGFEIDTESIKQLFAGMDDYAKTIDKISQKKQGLFPVNDNAEGMIEKQTERIKELQDVLGQLREAGASDLGVGGDREVEQLKQEIKIIHEHIKELKDEMSHVSDEKFEDLTLTIQTLNSELATTIERVNALTTGGTGSLPSGKLNGLGELASEWSKKGVKNSEGQVEFERYSPFNSQTGKISSTELVSIGGAVSEELIRSAIEQAEFVVDGFIHSHPANYASASTEDLESFFNLATEGVTRQAIMAAQDVLSFDMSKVDLSKKDEMLAEVSEAYDAADEMAERIPHKIVSNLKEASEKIFSQDPPAFKQATEKFRKQYSDYLDSLGDTVTSGEWFSAVDKMVKDIANENPAMGEDTRKKLRVYLKNLQNTIAAPINEVYDDDLQKQAQKALTRIFSDSKYLKAGETSAISHESVGAFTQRNTVISDETKQAAAQNKKLAGSTEEVTDASKEAGQAVSNTAEKFAEEGRIAADAAEKKEALAKAEKEVAEASAETTAAMREMSTVSPTQEFDNEVQKNLVYLENYKNTIKEIDKLKLEPETEETKKKIEELNDLAKYFVSNMTTIRSENGGYISPEMMSFGYSWAPVLSANYTNDQLKDFRQIAHDNYGLSVNNPASEYSHITEELKNIEAQSESTRQSLAKDLVESKNYADNLASALATVVESREEIAKSYTSEKDKADYQKDIDKYLGKYPEISEIADKFKGWDDVFTFTSSDEWNNFLATLPQARTYLESIGYDFEKLADTPKVELFEDSQGQLSFVEGLTNAERQLGDTLEEVSANAKEASEQIEGQLSLDFSKATQGEEKYELAIAHNVMETAELAARTQAQTDAIRAQQAEEERLAKKMADVNEEMARRKAESEKPHDPLIAAADTAFRMDTNQTQVNKMLQDVYRLTQEQTDETVRLTKAEMDATAAEEQRAKAANIAAVRDLAMQQEIADAQKKNKAYIEATTTAIQDQTNAERALNEQLKVQAAKNVSDAYAQYEEELTAANAKTQEFEESIKEVIAITRSADSAGSSLDLLNDLQAEVNASNEARDSIEKLLKTVAKMEDTNKYTSDFVDEVLLVKSSLEQLSQEDIISPGQVEKASAAVAELEKASKLDINKPFKELTRTKYLEQISQYLSKYTGLSKSTRAELEGIADAMKRATNASELKDLYDQFLKVKTAARNAGEEVQSMFTNISHRLNDMNAKFIAQFLSWQDLIRYIRTAVNTIKELDDALVDLKKTTTMSSHDLEKFYQNSSDVAKQTGNTTAEIINQAAAWSRLGYSSNEAATEMAALSSQFAAISPGMNLDQATDGLVSTMKAFHIDVQNVEHEVMDSINRIGNTMATSNDEIVEMLKRSSAAMSAANNTLSETIALESAAVQITRNAETTGTAFRTISMRIRGYSEETEEYIGGIEELSGKIADLTKSAKTPGGISLFTDETKSTYKSTYQLLKEIAEIYHDLSDADQAALLEALAGKRGGQVLAGILDDFSEVEKAIGEIEKSYGSADDEMTIIQESISYKMNALKETWVGVLQELVSRSSIGDVIDTLTRLSEGVVDVVEAMGGLPGVIASVTAAFVTFKHSGQIEATFKNAAKSVQDYNTAMAGTTVEQAKMIKALNTSNTAMSRYLLQLDGSKASLGGYVKYLISAELETVALTVKTVALKAAMSIGLSLAITGVISLFTKLVTAQKEAREKAADLAETYKSESSSLSEQVDQYKKLHEQLEDAVKDGRDTYSIKEQLSSLQKTLNDQYGDEYEKLNLVNGAYEDQIGLIGELNKKKAQQYLAETGEEAFEEAFDYLDKERTYSFGELSVNADTQGLLPILEKYGINVDHDGTYTLPVQFEASITEAEEILPQFYADIEEYAKTHDLDILQINQIKEEISGKIRDISGDEQYSQYKAMREQYINATIASDDKLAASFEKGISLVDEYNKALSSGEGVEAASQKLEAYRKEINETTYGSEGIKEKFLGIFDGIDTALEKKNEIDQAFADTEKDFMEYAEKLRGLADVDLKNISDPQLRGAFNYLLHSLGLTSENADLLIDKLVELGIVQRGAKQETDELATAEARWSNELNQALTKLGLLKETNDGLEYDESWTKYLETIKQLNPELADNQMEVEKCALANMQFSKAVDDLSKNFKTYKEALKDADKLTPEYSDAINALADDLTYLTGFEFSLEDAADFLGTAENVDLLEKALNGSDEALQKLQERAADGVKIAIDTSSTDEIRAVVESMLSELPDEMKLHLNLDSDSFNTEIENFANWLNENSNMGEIDVHALLDASPFMQSLSILMAESSEVATAVKKMFEQLGWKVTWDTVKMPIPTGTKTTSLYIPNDVPKEIRDKYANAEGGAVKWDYVDVPTNIEYIPKGSGAKTPTSKYTPTALSPAQKTAAKQNIDKANGSDSKKDEYKEFIDYFERMIKVLDQSVDLLEAHLEDVVGSFAKNNLLDAEEDLIQKKMNGYSSAIDMYSQKASEALSKIPSDIAAKLLQGAVDIDEFVGEGNKEVVEAIQEYEKWADKVQDCRLNIVQLKEAIRQLELQKFNNVMKDFTDQFDLRQSAGIDLISKQIDLLKEAGELVGESFYQKQIDQANKQLQILSNEQAALVQQMNEALSNGIDRGSEEWLEMVNALTSVESKILDTKKAIEEFDNAILALHTEIFNRIQNQFAAFNNELSNMRELIADDSLPVATVDNKWTDEGITQLGLLTQEYELARYQVGQFDQEIEKLNADYLAGRYSATEYADALIDLKERQWDAVNAAESAKEAIVDLNKARVDIVVEGIEDEIEAYRKLIEAQKDALAAEKDLHDYRKQIAESNKTITDLERQLAAMADDDTAATVAKRKKLEEQLAEARENLDEQEYSHSIESQQDALDKQLEAYEDLRQKEIESLQESLLNEELIIAESFDRVRENSQLIGETILATAQQHGIEMSQALTDSWFTGENAVAHYGEVLSDATSAFIGNLQGVEYETYELQNKANETAEGLANMFATRADSLVDELVRSYTGEANLDAMTNALHDSLSRTIDGNYSGASAAAALDSIADAANGVADAANAAANALRAMMDAENAKNDYDWEAYQRAQQEENMLASQSAKRNHYTSIYGGANAGKVAVWKDRNGSYTFRARGSKSIPHDELAWTQENGPEMILSPTAGAILTPLSRGDAVLPTDQTANIWEWSKFDPSEFAKKLVQSMPNAGANVQANTMQVGSLVTVNGNVNDSMEMMQIASTTASAKIKQSFKELSNGINK